jgi:hypothetical protein
MGPQPLTNERGPKSCVMRGVVFLKTALPRAGFDLNSSIHSLSEVETIIKLILAIQCMPRDRRVAALKMLEDCCQRDTPQAHSHLTVARLDAMGEAVNQNGCCPM